MELAVLAVLLVAIAADWEVVGLVAAPFVAAFGVVASPALLISPRIGGL